MYSVEINERVEQGKGLGINCLKRKRTCST